RERKLAAKRRRKSHSHRHEKNAAFLSGNGASYRDISAQKTFRKAKFSCRGLLVRGRPGSDLLSQGLSHSTIGAEEFNGRVRDGIGLRLFAETTRPAKDKEYEASDLSVRLVWSTSAPHFNLVTGLAALWTLKMRAIKPIERLVPVSYMHYCTSTSGLSTWSSSTVLKGMLVLRWVSRLDAFSGYPVRT